MIAIIGAGISGLTLAYEMQKNNMEYILLESSGNPGGVINSSYENGYLLEKGPNMLMVDDKLKGFISNLGIEDEIAYPLPSYKKRYIYKNGAYRKLPSSPFSFLFNDFFSLKTKIDVLKELYNKTSCNQNNETLSDFFKRRFNKEIVDYIIDPLSSGIFAGNSNELLVKKTFPFLLKMEETYGSVLKGFLNNKAAPKKESISFKSGMKTLTDKIASELRGIMYHSKVTSIRKEGGSFLIHFTTKNKNFEIKAENIVISSPAWATAGMVRELYPSFANALEKIQYAPLVKVFTAFNRQDVKYSMDGYGGLNPSCENQYILGSIWNSSIYPDCCPADQVLITSMVGGSIHPEYTIEGDETIQRKVISDLKRYYSIQADPVYYSLHRIPKAIPQFDTNILPIDTYSKELEKEGVFICANWKDGAAIGDCMKKGMNIAGELKLKKIEMIY